MKIIFSTYKFAFQNPGGGEEIIHKLKVALEKRGHQVHFFNPWTTNLKNYDIFHEFSLLDWPNWDYLKESNIKVALTPTAWPRDSLFFILKLRLKEYIKKCLYGKKSFSLYHKLHIPHIIFPTTAIEMKRLHNVYNIPLDKMTIVNNGVELYAPMQKNDFKAKYGDTPYLLFVGNISKNKNLLLAMEIANALELLLIVVGGLDKDRKYVSKCRKKAKSNIQFLGYLEDKHELSSLYQNCAAVLITSDFETCSLVGLEGGAYGAKILITQYGGTKEIFKEYVTYIDPENTSECIIKCKKLIARKKNENLKKFVLEHYTWDKIAEKVEKNYKQIMKG